MYEEHGADDDLGALRRQMRYATRGERSESAGHDVYGTEGRTRMTIMPASVHQRRRGCRASRGRRVRGARRHRRSRASYHAAATEETTCDTAPMTRVSRVRRIRNGRTYAKDDRGGEHSPKPARKSGMAGPSKSSDTTPTKIPHIALRSGDDDCNPRHDYNALVSRARCSRNGRTYQDYGAAASIRRSRRGYSAPRGVIEDRVRHAPQRR